MKTKTLLGLFLTLILLYGCRSEKDEMSDLNAITDTFILVDYYAGVYKFVQIDNEYTIGIEDGLVQIPADFHFFESDEMAPYHKVNLKLTGIEKEHGTTKYQRYVEGSTYYLVKQAGEYSLINCCVHRTAFFNDYLYYVDCEE